MYCEMAGKSGDHDYVSTATGDAGDECSDFMDMDVSSAKDVTTTDDASHSS